MNLSNVFETFKIQKIRILSLMYFFLHFKICTYIAIWGIDHSRHFRAFTYTGEIFEEKGVLLPQDFPDHTYENCIERKLRIDLYFS